MDDTENVKSRIKHLVDIHLVLIPKNGNHPHCTTGIVRERIDYHDDGSESVYRYIEIGELAFEVIVGRSGSGMAQDK